jgi:hypothetical protein
MLLSRVQVLKVIMNLRCIYMFFNNHRVPRRVHHSHNRVLRCVFICTYSYHHVCSCAYGYSHDFKVYFLLSSCAYDYNPVFNCCYCCYSGLYVPLYVIVVISVSLAVLIGIIHFVDTSVYVFTIIIRK